MRYLSDVAGGILLGLVHFHLTCNKDFLCRFDLFVKSAEQVAVEADRVEYNVLISISLQVRWQGRWVNLPVLDICAADFTGTGSERWSSGGTYAAHLALVCRHLISNSKLNYKAIKYSN